MPLVSIAAETNAPSLVPVVEIQEEVYTYTNANNGAGPMWCSGSTCLVRSGERIFASGLETVLDAKPLNNCRWVLHARDEKGWTRVQADSTGLTREPSPMAAFPDGRIFMSINPTVGPGPQPNGGPARPDLLQFNAAHAAVAPTPLRPVWEGKPPFTEHSYRSLAADGLNQELILFQNIGYTHAEWTFRDQRGRWTAHGRLPWPNAGPVGEKPQPIRVCYPNVALRQREVHFVGVSDIVEPNRAWREFKKELTGQEWDYDFRRLFYTWTPEIGGHPFSPWIEIASRDKTAGWVSPGDLWLAPNGDVHLLWSERAIDERLRAKFFPDARQSHTLNLAIVRAGKVVRRTTLLESSEEKPGLIGSAGRFHVTPEGRLYVVHFVSGRDTNGAQVFENRLMEIRPDGTPGLSVPIRLEKPFTSYFTATVRAGSPASTMLEMFGLRHGAPNTLAYARVRLGAERVPHN